jgi:hypothetical protein
MPVKIKNIEINPLSSLFDPDKNPVENINKIVNRNELNLFEFSKFKILYKIKNVNIEKNSIVNLETKNNLLKKKFFSSFDVINPLNV